MKKNILTDNRNIVKVLVILFAFLFSPAISSAQTFTQRIQQTRQGEGTVTIHQDKAIDDLVNGQDSTAEKKKPVQKTTTATPAKPAAKPQKPEQAPATRQDTVQHQQPLATDTASTGPKRTYKTTGYRVQAFAGGNTRSDRQKAEQAGNMLRQLFPGEEVYVHFYSPRWICRVGNYRTYQEAREKMLEIRKMGYESATVVKGKITLSY